MKLSREECYSVLGVDADAAEGTIRCEPNPPSVPALIPARAWLCCTSCHAVMALADLSA